MHFHCLVSFAVKIEKKNIGHPVGVKVNLVLGCWYKDSDLGSLELNGQDTLWFVLYR